jgi:prepilin-type N-terminal cleavage/methylation domain-containing protein
MMSMHESQTRRRNGFTLIEVIIVIAIIAILATLAIGALIDAKCKGTATAVAATVSKCESVLVSATDVNQAITQCLTEAQKAMDDLHKNYTDWWNKHKAAILGKAKDVNEELDGLISRAPEESKPSIEKLKLKNPEDGQVVK